MSILRLMRARAYLLLIAFASCSMPTRSTTAASSERPEALRGWSGLEGRDLWWSGAKIDTPHGAARVISLRGVADVIDGSRVRIGDLELEGRLAASSCLVSPLRRQSGDLVLDLRRGARLFIRGVDGDRYRVSDGLDLMTRTFWIPIDRLSSDACNDDVGSVSELRARCIHGSNTEVLDQSAQPRILRWDVRVSIHEQQGDWARIEATSPTHHAVGWAHADDLNPAPVESFLTTREVPSQTEGLMLPAGTPIARSRHRAVIEHAGRRMFVRIPEVPMDSLQPDPQLVAERARAAMNPTIAAAGSQCWAPGTKLEVANLRRGLSKPVIRRVIRSHIDEVRECYEAQLAVDPNLEGRFVAHFLISPDGRVEGADSAPAGSVSLPVEQCILRKLVHWRFPAADGGGAAMVHYPFALRFAR